MGLFDQIVTVVTAVTCYLTSCSNTTSSSTTSGSTPVTVTPCYPSAQLSAGEQWFNRASTSDHKFVWSDISYDSACTSAIVTALRSPDLSPVPASGNAYYELYKESNVPDQSKVITFGVDAFSIECKSNAQVPCTAVWNSASSLWDSSTCACSDVSVDVATRTLSFPASSIAATAESLLFLITAWDKRLDKPASHEFELLALPCVPFDGEMKFPTWSSTNMDARLSDQSGVSYTLGQPFTRPFSKATLQQCQTTDTQYQIYLTDSTGNYAPSQLPVASYPLSVPTDASHADWFTIAKNPADNTKLLLSLQAKLTQSAVQFSNGETSKVSFYKLVANSGSQKSEYLFPVTYQKGTRVCSGITMVPSFQDFGAKTVSDSLTHGSEFLIEDTIQSSGDKVCAQSYDKVFVELEGQTAKLFGSQICPSEQKHSIESPALICRGSDDYKAKLSLYAGCNDELRGKGFVPGQTTLCDKTNFSSTSHSCEVRFKVWQESYSDSNDRNLMQQSKITWHYKEGAEACNVVAFAADFTQSFSPKDLMFKETYEVLVKPWTDSGNSCVKPQSYKTTVVEVPSGASIPSFIELQTQAKIGIKPSSVEMAVAFNETSAKLSIQPVAPIVVGKTFVAFVSAHVADCSGTDRAAPTNPIVFSVKTTNTAPFMESSTFTKTHSFDANARTQTFVYGDIKDEQKDEIAIHKTTIVDPAFSAAVISVVAKKIDCILCSTQWQLEVSVTAPASLLGRKTDVLVTLEDKNAQVPLKSEEFTITVEMNANATAELNKYVITEAQSLPQKPKASDKPIPSQLESPLASSAASTVPEPDAQTTPSETATEPDAPSGLQEETAPPVSYNPKAIAGQNQVAEKSKMVVKIERLDHSGRMKIAFNNKVRLPRNCTAWTDTNEGAERLKINFAQNQANKHSLEDQNITMKFMWRVFRVGTVNSKLRVLEATDIGLVDVDWLEIQLVFSAPMYVSSGANQFDAIDVKIPHKMFANDTTEEFETRFDGKEIKQARINVPRLMSSEIAEAMESAVETTQSSVMALGTSNIVLSIIFAGLLQYLWGMVNTMQMIMLTALFSLLIPSNAEMIMFSILQMSNLDLFDSEQILGLMFQFKETNAFNRIYDFAGYHSSNFLIEAGPLFFIIVGFTLFVMLRALVLVATRRAGENRCTRFLRRRVQWNAMIVRFSLEGCFGLGLVAVISLHNPQNWQMDTAQDSVAHLFAILMLVFLLLTTVYIARSAHKVFAEKDEEKKKAHGGLFHKLRMDKLAPLYTNVLFMLRRLTIIVAMTVLVDHPLIQIWVYMLATNVALCFQIMVKPYDDFILNFVEVVNESFIFLAAYHLFFFTDFMSDPEMTFNLGWSLMLLIGVQLLFSIVIFIIIVISQTKRSCRRFFALRAAKKAMAERLRMIAVRKQILEAFPLSSDSSQSSCQQSQSESSLQSQSQREVGQVEAVIQKVETPKQLIGHFGNADGSLFVKSFNEEVEAPPGLDSNTPLPFTIGSGLSRLNMPEGKLDRSLQSLKLKRLSVDGDQPEKLQEPSLIPARVRDASQVRLDQGLFGQTSSLLKEKPKLSSGSTLPNDFKVPQTNLHDVLVLPKVGSQFEKGSSFANFGTKRPSLVTTAAPLTIYTTLKPKNSIYGNSSLF